MEVQDKHLLLSLPLVAEPGSEAPAADDIEKLGGEAEEIAQW